MDSEKLKYFVAAAYSLNFSEVARSFFISQPTISHQIDLLEQELGVKLFFRNGKKLSLTSEGKTFLPTATKLLDEIHAATTTLRQHSCGEAGSLRVLVSETGSTVFKNCLGAFHKKYPNIIVSTYFALTPEQTKALNNNSCDIYFVAEVFVKSRTDLDYIITQQDHMCLVLPKDVPLPEDPNDFSSFKDLPFISVNNENSPMFLSSINHILRKRNCTSKTIGQYNKMSDILISVDLGIGFTICPYSIVKDTNLNVAILPFDEENCCENLTIAWNKQNLNHAAKFFLDTAFEIYT